MPTLTSTVRQQGNSAVTTIPAEVGRRLGVEPGSDLTWVEDGLGGFRVSLAARDTAKIVEIHEDVMRKYDSVFRALAK
jgi:putative addiction module antidote